MIIQGFTQLKGTMAQQVLSSRYIQPIRLIALLKQLFPEGSFEVKVSQIIFSFVHMVLSETVTPVFS